MYPSRSIIPILLVSAGCANQDVDKDGYTVAEGDCADLDPQRHPGAADPAGGEDGNCDDRDGQDVDDDGYLASEVGGDDCNDLEKSINPASEDVPDDGIDQDCTGTDRIQCSYGDVRWIDINREPDARDDQGAYPVDLAGYSYTYDGTTLWLRAEAWQDFDESHPDFQVDLHVNMEGVLGFNLSYDNVYPPPLQLWSWVDDYAAPSPDPPDSLFFCPDTSDAIVLGVDLADLFLGHQEVLNGDAAVGYWFTSSDDRLHEDYVPDGPTDNDVPFCLRFQPDFEILASAVSGGDEDPFAEAEEQVRVRITVRNWCLVSTSQGVHAEMSVAAGYDGTAVVTAGAADAPDMDPVEPGETTEVEFGLDLGASPGTLVPLELRLSDERRSYDPLVLQLPVGPE